MKKTKKILTVFLALMIAGALVPTSAKAAEPVIVPREITGVIPPVVGEPSSENIDDLPADIGYSISGVLWRTENGTMMTQRFMEDTVYHLMIEISADIEGGLKPYIEDPAVCKRFLQSFMVEGGVVVAEIGRGKTEVATDGNYINLRVDFPKTTPFVPVTSITEVPDTAAATIPLPLAGTVVPGDATFQNIIWSIDPDPGATTAPGSLIDGSSNLTANGEGKVTVIATIEEGIKMAPDGYDPEDGTAFVQRFEITITASSSAPTITGPDAVALTQGYAATATDTFTITGSPSPTVTKSSGDPHITWNAAGKKLEIAEGLAPGNYPVTLTASNGQAPSADWVFTLTVSPQNGSGSTTEVSVDGTVTVTGDNIPFREFTFVLTQLGVSNPIVVQTTASTTDRNFSFTIPHLNNGDYYFEIKEDTSNIPEGWTYDTASYPVRVIVEDGRAMVYYSNGTFDGSVSAGKEQTIVIDPEHVISTGGNVHNEVLGIPCYDHFGHGKANMHYRNVTNANGEIVIGAAYCIDYFVLEVDNDNDPTTGDYAPHFDYDDFVDHFTGNDMSGHGHTGNIEQILWLGHNGFMSDVAGDVNGNFGENDTDNNLSDIRELTGVSNLSAAEAYSATQLAIWHFTDGMIWLPYGQTASTDPGTKEREITNVNVSNAYEKLIEEAGQAANASDETLITELSVAVNFDLSGASYAGGLYGPVKLAVNLAPENFTDPLVAPVTLSPAAGLTLYAGNGITALTADTELYSGDSFYVGISSPPASGTKLADAAISASLNILDTFALTSASGWDVQAVIGAGKATRNVQATASLYVGKSDAGGIVFSNTYLASPSTPPSTPPSSPPENVPYTGDDSNLTGWLIALLMSVLGILLLFIWRKRRRLKGRW